jgi:uncharacterized protein (TIGR03118 family)
MLRLALRAAVVVAALSLMLVAAAPLPAAPGPPPSDQYAQTNLVSDMPGVAANTDANLQNAWGLARSGTSPWWVADNGSNVTTIYNSAGALQSIGGHPFQGVDGNPTGAVFSGITGQFQVGTTASPTTLGTSLFIFDGEDGQIRAWRGGSTAALVTVSNAVTGADAVLKGLAISNDPSIGPRLYATDFHNGRVDVFDGSWTMINDPGAFTDPNMEQGYAPFGIQTIGNRIFVTYAKQDSAAHDDAAGQGHGFVDAYDLNGTFLGRVAQHGQLNSPWGLAWAPAGFGRFAGDLLVGNFGDGQVNAFEEMGNGQFAPRGSLRSTVGGKLAIEGLWSLQFAAGGSNGTPDQLFFTAGPNDEADGLFGFIKST